MRRDREADAVFAVRFLLLVGALAICVAFAVAGLSKIVAPGHQVGHLAMTIAWPVGAGLALLLRWQRVRHRDR